MKVTFDIDENSLKRLADQLSNNEAFERAMGRACAVVERKAKENAPKDTGELRRSITSEVNATGGLVEGVVFTPLEYAPYVEYGTGIHAENGRKDVPWFIPIGPEFPLSKAEKYNMRIFKGEGGKMWAMSFGQHPQPFMRPALEECREEILRILKEAFND